MTDLREDERPYTLYRSAPRSLTSRLRGETDAELEARELLMRDEPPRGPGGGDGRSGGPGGPRPPRRGWRRIPGFGPSTRPLWHPLRLLKFFVMACIFWVVLSAVLFFISAETKSGNLPGGSATEAALSSAGPMLFTPNNILILGLDVRPKTGYSSGEAGANHSEANAATDSIMIWRVGGGTSRKLSIPRDTLTYVPCGAQSGMMKINAAWACGGPQNTIHVIERLTGIKINHMVVIDFANFIKFIDDIGGVTVKTPRICSEISGGAANGGFTLNLQPGYHHLTGEQAITLARTRHNSCNLAYNDFDRQLMQQQIVNAMKGQMLSVHAFIHLPWAAWDAPGAIQTDMGGLTMMQLFIASEIGGTSNPVTLGGAFQTYNGQDVVVPSQDDIHSKVNQLMNG